MDASKGIDRTNMSLDDIIKLNRQSNNKTSTIKNTSTFSKNSIFRGRINTASTVPFNRNRLGVGKKRDFIKTNIVINKRSNINSRLNITVPHINATRNTPLNLKSKSFNDHRNVLTNVPAIRITAPNDHHQAFNRNNSERQPINRNLNDNFQVKSFTSKSFRDISRPTSENIRDRRSFDQNGSEIRSSNPWNRDDHTWHHFRQPDTQRKSFNERSDFRHNISQSDTFSNYVTHKDQAYRVLNSGDHSGLYKNRYFDEEYRRSDKDSIHRNADRSNDREYEAMARALIEAHKDSHKKSYQSRYDTDRSYSYRR